MREKRERGEEKTKGEGLRAREGGEEKERERVERAQQNEGHHSDKGKEREREGGSTRRDMGAQHTAKPQSGGGGQERAGRREAGAGLGWLGATGGGAALLDMRPPCVLPFLSLGTSPLAHSGRSSSLLRSRYPISLHARARPLTPSLFRRCPPPWPPSWPPSPPSWRPRRPSWRPPPRAPPPCPPASCRRR